MQLETTKRVHQKGIRLRDNFSSDDSVMLLRYENNRFVESRELDMEWLEDIITIPGFHGIF